MRISSSKAKNSATAGKVARNIVKQSFCSLLIASLLSSVFVGEIAPLIISASYAATDLKKEPVIDNYYRDLCIQTGGASRDEFNEETGRPINTTTDQDGNQTTDEGLPYSMKFQGNIYGAKPKKGECVKLLNTPVITGDTSGNASFGFYRNANNDNFYSQDRYTYYGTSNNYITSSFFVGSTLGCPESIFTGIAKNPKTAAGWKRRAERCYDYYIYQRATNPELTFERAGKRTDDPLSEYAPDVMIRHTCEPLIDGHNSQKILNGDDFLFNNQFTPLQQSNNQMYDQAEYKPSTYLTRSWNRNFPGQPAPKFPDYLPCVVDGGSIPPKPKVNFAVVNGIAIIGYLVIAVIECLFLDYCKGPVYHVPFDDPLMHGHIRSDIKYTSPATKKDGYCPNHQKLNDPGFITNAAGSPDVSNPFAPRDDYLHISMDIYSPTQRYRTDRGYSFETSLMVLKERILNGFGQGYLDKVNTDIMTDPVVQCAIVPVDILGMRRAAFNNCIMQRIENNFFAWRHNNFLEFYGLKNNDWKPPCSTKVNEADSNSDPIPCAATLSIQQCCQIIVKPIAPLNFVKLRTCEGKREKLRGILGDKNDHIYGGDSLHGKKIDGSSGSENDTLGNWWEEATKLTKKIGDGAGECDKDHKELTFKYYFPPMLGQKLSNKPYMRWWDTGSEAGLPANSQSFINTLGTFDAIVGVGREEIIQDDIDDVKNSETPSTIDENSAAYPKVRPAETAKIAGWEGLKAHQMWTLRNNNLNCIGRTEKLFQLGGAENFVLHRAGANFAARQDSAQWEWPLGWRGYAKDTENGFEKNVSLSGNFDNAETGDIVFYTINGIRNVGFVTSGYNKSNQSVTVEAWDQGKLLTNTGSGPSYGQPMARTFYKDSKFMPDADKDRVKNAKGGAAKSAGNVPSCEDPYYTACLLSDWNGTTVYKHKKDKSRLCDKQFSYKDAKGNTVSSNMNSFFSKSLDTAKIPSNVLSSCILDGYDPPVELRLNSGYTGNNTGAKMDTTQCGPKWGSCSTRATTRQCFNGFKGHKGNDVIKCPTN